VPTDPSSSIPAALTQLAHADPLRPAETPHLLAYLSTIRDPRSSRGRRHPLVAILAIAAAAVLTGARSMTAIAEWAPTPHSRSVPRSAPAAMPRPLDGTGRGHDPPDPGPPRP
jgi:DDE_Tnp_1-associated